MASHSLLKIGVTGTIISAVCCFTPALVVILGGIGMSAVVGYLDLVLFPALVLFATMTGYALWRTKTT